NCRSRTADPKHSSEALDLRGGDISASYLGAEEVARHQQVGSELIGSLLAATAAASTNNSTRALDQGELTAVVLPVAELVTDRKPLSPWWARRIDNDTCSSPVAKQTCSAAMQTVVPDERAHLGRDGF